MVSRIRTCVLIVSTALLASSAFAEERPYMFPVKLEKTGYLGGFWDVGACYVSGQPTEEALRKLADRKSTV